MAAGAGSACARAAVCATAESVGDRAAAGAPSAGSAATGARTPGRAVEPVRRRPGAGFPEFTCARPESESESEPGQKQDPAPQDKQDPSRSRSRILATLKTRRPARTPAASRARPISIRAIRRTQRRMTCSAIRTRRGAQETKKHPRSPRRRTWRNDEQPTKLRSNPADFGSPMSLGNARNNSGIANQLSPPTVATPAAPQPAQPTAWSEQDSYQGGGYSYGEAPTENYYDQPQQQYYDQPPQNIRAATTGLRPPADGCPRRTAHAVVPQAGRFCSAEPRRAALFRRWPSPRGDVADGRGVDDACQHHRHAITASAGSPGARAAAGACACARCTGAEPSR